MQEDSNKNAPRSDKRTTSTKKNMRFPNDLVEQINEQLEDNPNPSTKDRYPKIGFAEWVVDACWQKLGQGN